MNSGFESYYKNSVNIHLSLLYLDVLVLLYPLPEGPAKPP